MAVLRQSVSAAHHEQGAIEHGIQIKDPGRRRVKDIPLEHLNRYCQHQDHDQPGEQLARPGADAIGHADETGNIHEGCHSKKTRSLRISTGFGSGGTNRKRNSKRW
jgi:hypothetical protein